VTIVSTTLTQQRFVPSILLPDNFGIKASFLTPETCHLNTDTIDMVLFKELN
jgi:hypothetical protein